MNENKNEKTQRPGHGSAGEPGEGAMQASMILAELVYERVRASVNLCQLVVMEHELEESIQRALAESDRAMEDAGELARGYIQRAWDRMQAEWQALREDLGALAGARGTAAAADAAAANASIPGDPAHCGMAE